MTDAAPGVAALTLVTGSEDLLVSRAVGAVVAAARGVDPQAELRDIAAGALTDADLIDLASPSMFADLRVVVIRGAWDLSEEQREVLLGHSAAPVPGLALVVVAAGSAPSGTRGKRLADALTAAGATVRHCSPMPRVTDRIEFVQAEARALDTRLTGGAARAVVDSASPDLRELAVAVAQLAADGGGVIDEEAVGRLRAGRSETRGFEVADAAARGDIRGAVGVLAGALVGGTPPVVIIAALAAGLRDVVRVRGGGDGSPAALARALGMPAWKVEKVLRVGRGWTDDALARAVRAVAAGDVDVKGGAADPSYATLRTVLAVARERSRG
ncbi:MAG: DNA polymerase III subunit delta [Mycobacteriales bacterium]